MRTHLIESEIIHKNGELTSVGETLKRIVMRKQNDDYSSISSGWEPPMG
jgi:hypothetical protein